MKLDKRTKTYRQYRTFKTYYKENRGALWFAFFMGLLSAGILAKTLKDSQKTSLRPLGSVNETRVVQVVKAEERAFCNDPINCFRDVGESIGISNKDIMIAIRISKAECGMVVDRISLPNKNGTLDIGVMQINDIHNKRISRADRLDYEKSIRFAYKLRLEQGNWNAWSVCRSKVDCK